MYCCALIHCCSANQEVLPLLVQQNPMSLFSLATAPGISVSCACAQLEDVKQPPQLPAAQPGQPAVTVRGASFSWDGEGEMQPEPALSDMDIQVGR